jgi:hypothetical protein
MDQQRPAKRILDAEPEDRRNRGRPKRRWEDEVDNMLSLGEGIWKNLATNRQIWQNLLRKDMAQKWLFCQ